MIKSLRFQSFRGFEDFTIELSPFTVLVGANSSGKTSVLHGITLLHEFIAYVFRSQDTPNTQRARLTGNGNQLLQKMNPSDPDAVWLHKRTASPCTITAEYSDSYTFELRILGRDSYTLKIWLRGNLISDTPATLSHHADNITNILKSNPVYVPPVGGTSPTEQKLLYPNLVLELNEGRSSQFWRNQLYWLLETGKKYEYDKAASFVSSFIGGSNILPPRVTPTNPEFIKVEYVQDGVTFDIGMTGSGQRVILNTAVNLFALESHCFLFDEPDAHLHGSLQRLIDVTLYEFASENDKQIIVATHSPEFLNQIPIDNLVWVDRSQSRGTRCTELGKILVDLGALGPSEAIRVRDVKNLLFVEGDVDLKIMGRLFELAQVRNPLTDSSVVVAQLPNGKGDVKHVEMFPALVKKAFNCDVKVACKTDNDYDLSSRATEPTVIGQVMIGTLERKEVENFLIEPLVFASAAAFAAERRKQHGSTAVHPSESDVRERLRAILDDSPIYETVRYQLIPKYRDALDRKLDPSERERNATEWFEDNWKDWDWKLKHCSGKEVLRHLRAWCQEEYGLTITTRALSQSLTMCSPEFQKMASAIQEHLWQR